MKPTWGVTKVKQLAHDAVFWPNINKQLEECVLRCDTCQRHRKAIHMEPLINHNIACKPYYKIGVDLFELNHEHFLLSVDYYSKYPEVMLLSHTSSPSVINALKENFARNGIPHIVVSDNGPQLQSHEYHIFAIKYDFQPSYSSPQYPRSTGQVERFVQMVKNMLTKCADFQRALLNYHNTPIPELNLSSAQLLMSRQLR